MELSSIIFLFRENPLFQKSASLCLPRQSRGRTAGAALFQIQLPVQQHRRDDIIDNAEGGKEAGQRKQDRMARGNGEQQAPGGEQEHRTDDLGDDLQRKEEGNTQQHFMRREAVANGQGGIEQQAVGQPGDEQQRKDFQRPANGIAVVLPEEVQQAIKVRFLKNQPTQSSWNMARKILPRISTPVTAK